MSIIEDFHGVEKFTEQPRITFAELSRSPDFIDDLWKPSYGKFDEEEVLRVKAKIDFLHDLLQQVQAAPEDELHQVHQESINFIEDCWKTYEDPQATGRDPGSFAFVVPTRTRREVLGSSDGYMDEWLELYPILKYVDSSIGQRLITGTPPMIIDNYEGVDESGRRGYMLFAPFYTDMLDDIWTDRKNVKSDRYWQQAYEFGVTAQNIFNSTLEFAKRLGVNTVGFGATLPKVMMDLKKNGLDIGVEDIEITTGHATTIVLMEKTLQGLIDSGVITKDNPRVGVIGAGYIGTGFSEYYRAKHGINAEINIMDINPVRVAEAIGSPVNYGHVTESVAQLIKHSDVIVCAVTTPIKLEDILKETDSAGVQVVTEENMEGLVIVDDSQPGCFDKDEIESVGGTLAWVIAEDPSRDTEKRSGKNLLRRNKFTYSGMGPAQQDEIWGCELEALLVHQEGKLTGITEAVGIDDIQQIASIIESRGIAVAPPQSQGEYIVLAR